MLTYIISIIIRVCVSTSSVTPNSSVNLSVSSSGEFDGRNVYIEQDGEFNITCMAAGGPKNSHFWRLNGYSITANETFTILSFVQDSMSVSILRVRSVDAATHKGNYICEVINEVSDHAGGLTVHGELISFLTVTFVFI